MTMVRRIGSTAFVVLVGVASLADAQNTTTRISVTTSGTQGNAASGTPSLSDDGRYITFTSGASNLVPGDTNNQSDIFVRDRQLEILQRVNLGVGGEQALGGASNNPSISNDGRFVQFTSSAANLIGLDTNDLTDIFVHDRQTNVTTRVSVASGGTQAVGGVSFGGVMTPDARYVAFASGATNLVTVDSNSTTDVFLHDRQTGTTARVSLTSGGLQATGGPSFSPSLSANGRIVAFASRAIDLVSGDTNAKSDVFVRDLQAGTTTRISLGPGGAQANDDSSFPSVSGDGRFVAFESRATTLVPNGGPGIYVHDRTDWCNVRPQPQDGGDANPVLAPHQSRRTLRVLLLRRVNHDAESALRAGSPDPGEDTGRPRV